jgi:hypothetical protein
MFRMKMTSTIISSSLLFLSLCGMAIHSSVAIAAPYFATTADATAAATNLGYIKTKDISNRQAVYMVTKTSTVKGLTYSGSGSYAIDLTSQL